MTKRVMDEGRPMGQRVNALHSILANHFAPLGFEATRQRLREHVGVEGSAWSGEQVVTALRLLHESRQSHLRYRSAFGDRRRVEKAAGRRQPTKADLEALHTAAWLLDVTTATSRLPGRRQQRG